MFIYNCHESSADASGIAFKMQYSASLLTAALLVLSVTATPTVYSADSEGALTKLDARNAYALGVNLYNQGGCGGNIQAVRNHDKSSCQSATRAGSADNWLSALDKVDGADKGVGCMTTFSDTGCNANGKVYYLNGDGACVNFSNVKCVVVAERGSNGVCNVNTPTC